MSANAPRPRSLIALWVGQLEVEVEDDRVNDERSCAAAADDDNVDDVDDGFFFPVPLLFLVARPRSSSRVLGGRVHRFPIEKEEERREKRIESINLLIEKSEELFFWPKAIFFLVSHLDAAEEEQESFALSFSLLSLPFLSATHA